VPPHIGLSSELTHPGRPYELTLLVSTLLVQHCNTVTSVASMVAPSDLSMLAPTFLLHFDTPHDVD